MSRTHAQRHRSDAALADLGGHDEVGTPDDLINECGKCGTLHRIGDDTHAELCGGVQ